MSMPTLLARAGRSALDKTARHASSSDAQSGAADVGRLPDGEVPLLIHFDVNKTILQTDSIQLKDAEDGIREGIAELFWGHTRIDGDKSTWEWTRSKPSCLPPTDDIRTAGDSLMNYAQFCKASIKDKSFRKEAVKTFSLVSDSLTKQEMNKQLQLAMKKMQLPPEFRGSHQVEAAGIKGMTYNAFPSLFHLVANLQRSRRPFAILFRSFGVDHEKVQTEWNAFCELRHPIFSRLIDDIGPMDGSTPGVPDRRVHTLHTLYRDAAGPVLILDTLTNGPEEASWDAWARSSPPPKVDTRNGRQFVQNVLKAKTTDGIPALQKWMSKQLLHQRTAAIKDDWAWWTFKREQAHAGKLLTLIGGRRPTQQLFLDDNIEHNDARIVDVRDPRGSPLPQGQTLGRICVKVNPVEAILDNDYFLWKLLRAQGDRIDVGNSLMGLQRKKLVEVESQNSALQDQLSVSNGQLRLLVEEMRRMRLKRRVAVRDEGELLSLLGKHGADVAAFGQGGHRSVSDLHTELEQGHCWLEVDEHGQLVRVLDMVFFKLCFKDMLLIETHEEDSAGRMSTRNFLPGLTTAVKEASVQEQVEQWLESGLQANLQKCVVGDLLPMYVPDAPNQLTGSTKAYPLRCVVQQSRVMLSIPEKEVEINKGTLQKIGLPSGQRFRTMETDLHGSTITRFWRWDKTAVWEASSGLAAGGAKGAAKLNVAELCDKLFQGNQRADAYKRLLLEMFEAFESFEAQMLTGGFGGSAVIRVQPYEQDGRPSEPCVVKLDTGKLIRDEFQKSVNVFAALPDRAARILGDPVFSANEEFGAMRLELAGACWNNPELAQGTSSSNLLSTFKDLLLYESEQALLGVGSSSTAADNRPFGNVNSVIAETFGPGGVVSALRKGDKGLRRAEGPPLLWGWYTLKGKPSRFNPYTAAKGEYPAEPLMRRLYKEHFRADMPTVKELGIDSIKEKLIQLSGQAGKELFPLVGLAHGDLNAANIMIDASDALWLIDFATSVDLPLFTDMCKFEMACLFEYATIPITPKMLVEFAGTQESLWQSMNVGDWLRTDQDVVAKLLQKLVALPPERLSGLTQGDLDQLIDEVVKRTGKGTDRQRKMERSLKSRLVADEAMVSAAFSYCTSISNALLRGDKLGETLNVHGVPLPEGRGARGVLSLKLFMDHCVAVRRFMHQDVMGCLKDRQNSTADLQPCDWMSLQLYLPLLRESYRIIGYRDVAPQYKIWAIYHCSRLAQCVQQTLGVISKNSKKLENAGFLSSLKMEIESAANEHNSEERRSEGADTLETAQETSYWIHEYSHLVSAGERFKKVMRVLHSECPRWSSEPGFFSPIWQVHAVGDSSGHGSVRIEWLHDFCVANKKTHTEQLLDLCVEVGDEPRIKIGSMMAPTGRREATVHLESRFLRWEPSLVRAKREELARAEEGGNMERRESLGDDFSIHAWAGGALESILGRTPKKAAPPVFSKVEATAFDRNGNKKMRVSLVVGVPICCYPSGATLCLDSGTESGDQLKTASSVVIKLRESGDYLIGNLEEKGKQVQSEFDPLPGNHTFLIPCRYDVEDQILVRRRSASGGWNVMKVIGLPTQESGFHHRLEQSGYPSQLRLLSPFNSGKMAPGVSGEMFQEETERFKQNLRARLSFIIDPLSGDRLSVRECAPLSLTQLGPVFCQTSGTSSCPNVGVGVGSAAPDSVGGHARSAGNRQGWASIMGVIERFEKGIPSCAQNAFLVLGPPGSGKTCLIHRLVMEAMDRCTHIVPLLLPVADLAKRSCQDPELMCGGQQAVDQWFDKYLRITFGEDSHRYLMICHAIRMNHAMFIFEGLEDCGEAKPIIERCIRRQVLQRRLVVVTSRMLISGQSSLEDICESLVAMRVENLTEEHIRMVAHARLGLNGIDAFDRIFAKVRGSKDVTDADTVPHAEHGVEGESKPEVFGNPMMLSMLLCYLQTMRRKEAERREAQRKGEADDEKGDEGEGTTITSIYRVAVDVMLMRMQRRQMADRLNQHEELDRWKQILEVMALHMAVHEQSSIAAGEVETLLRGQLRRHWPGLKKAVLAGHAMFLRVADTAREDMHFLDKDFLSFFAASAVARGGGNELPGLTLLFSDPRWAQVLEMLAEAWPLQYVRVIEHRLGSFRSEGGDSYLHVAARAGHRPIFRSLRLFSDRNRSALKTQNQELQTPLHIAAENGSKTLCALMLENGAPADVLDSKERLAIHVAMQNGNFQIAKFLMQHWSRQERSATQLYSRRSRAKGEQLASRVLGELSGKSSPQAAEKEFLQAVDSHFTELEYFSSKEADMRKSTVCALLAVFWVAANYYDLFARGQPEATRLKAASWEKLQDWSKRTVGLTQSPSMLSATLVFVAIMNLGKIKGFRLAFAPDVDEPDEALASVLEKAPILIPSFMKLEEHQRQAILSALKANFNFGQFLQAENLPGNLSSAKQILMETGGASGSVNTLGLFLFRNFAALSGLRGKDSLEGSLFMTDTFYSNYKVGLDVLKHLMSESAQQVYERFLKERARGQSLSFSPHDPESRACVRLACLARVFDADGGKEVSAALAAMQPAKRWALIHFLNADGIKQKPGFLLYFAPQVLANARKNASIGLMLGLEMLVSVYEAAAKEYSDSEKPVVTVMLPELVDHTLSCGDAESFRCTRFEIARASDGVGTLHLSPWQVWNDPTPLESLSADALSLADSTLGSKVREPAFLKRLPQAFPELRFFPRDEDSKQKASDAAVLVEVAEGNKEKVALRETQLALLTVFWVAGDQLEAFSRGQEASVKLSPKSWGKIRQLAEKSGMNSPDILDSLFVTMALHKLGRIPKFGAQLAPTAGGHRHVIAQVLEASPKVLPSFWRLSPQYRQVVKGCLSRRLFNFRQFLDAESVPASVATIKGMLSGMDWTGELTSTQILHLFMFMVFVEMSACTAAQSLEGSLCMTEKLWREFEVGFEALKSLESETEATIYNRLLQLRCKTLELDFDAANPELRAVARLALLAGASNPGPAARVREAFGQLANSERAALMKYLNADGISIKPGFVFGGGRAFLSSALSNPQVGILPALRVLLLVCREAEKLFRLTMSAPAPPQSWSSRGSSMAVLTINLERLAAFAQDFAGSVTFQEISFELLRESDGEATAVPKVWIPVRNPAVLNTLRMQGRELASELLSGNNKISEMQFKARLERTFPELSYFKAASEQLSKTTCALMSVYWLVTNQHEAFIRGQPDNQLLSKHSWSWLQGWTKQSVRLVSEEAVDAMLTFVAISALGTIPEFREEFAPKVNSRIHDAVLSHILESQPEVVPSFQRLPEKYKILITDCLRVNFRFSEFLLAENVPANLAQIKTAMEPHGEEGLAFFCFRIFSRACGKLGARHLWGSLFMTEAQIQRFRPGLEALQSLKTLDAGAAYSNYLLLLQGSKALACFTSPEHQALTRLLCLDSTNDDASAAAVSEAFKELQPREREKLTRLLTADGLGVEPGYVLCGAPELLRAAALRPQVGVAAALRMLLRLQEKCTVGSHIRKVRLHLYSLVAEAREAPTPRHFLQTPLQIHSDDQGDTRVCTVAVAGTRRLEGAAGKDAAAGAGGASAAVAGSAFWRLLGGMACSRPPELVLEREDA